ncbi:MAG: MBL fold metallo-hydrolase [Oscillospiraceae bacterium]|nr:MBL fold metallo-hydrolase [Oscillospiraceae bacterium]
MEEILKNIYRIPIPLPDNPLKELNSYYIRDPKRSLLIDTGFRHPECRQALAEGLRELGAQLDEVDIFLTHMHADHTGLSSEIGGGDFRIFVSAVDGKLLEALPAPGASWGEDKWVWNKSREQMLGMPDTIIDNIEKLNPALKYAPLGGAKYTHMRDGDILSVGGYNLQCVLTPGHSPGHMCLWDESCGLLFTGDHVLFDITPNITAWPDVEDSLGDYLDSLRAVKTLPVKTALPGHRKSGDFHARIDVLLAHHENRLIEAETIVKDNPGLTAYEIAGKMRWKIRAIDWHDFPASQKIFAVGECLAHLNYLSLRGRLMRKIDTDDNVYRFYKENK